MASACPPGRVPAECMARCWSDCCSCVRRRAPPPSPAVAPAWRPFPVLESSALSLCFNQVEEQQNDYSRSRLVVHGITGRPRSRHASSGGSKGGDHCGPGATEFGPALFGRRGVHDVRVLPHKDAPPRVVSPQGAQLLARRRQAPQRAPSALLYFTCGQAGPRASRSARISDRGAQGAPRLARIPNAGTEREQAC